MRSNVRIRVRATDVRLLQLRRLFEPSDRQVSSREVLLPLDFSPRVEFPGFSGQVAFAAEGDADVQAETRQSAPAPRRARSSG